MHPIASSSITWKPKKHKEKAQRHRPSSPDADARVHAGTLLRNETVSSTAPAVEATRTDGLVPADCDVEFGDFDFDAVKAEEGAELWLVRAPSSVRLARFVPAASRPTSRARAMPTSPVTRHTPF